MFPIRLLFQSDKKRLSLHFMQEAERRGVMNLIMKAKGYASQIDQYQVIAQIGKTTLKAVHKQTRKAHVIKIIKRLNSNSSCSLSELHLQSILEPMKKDGFAPLTEHIIDDDFIYLIRPSFNCGNVLEALKNYGVNQLTENELRRGAPVFFGALNTIHKAGYLHGDVRPQSLLINRSKDSDKIKLALGKYECCCPIDKQAE